MSPRGTVLALAALAGAACAPDRAAAGPVVHVAVAANFVEALDALAPRFRALTGAALVVSSGSTGKLFAQIENGAPFDVFLAADEERPRRLVADGFAVAGTRFPYALGRLALVGAVDPADGLATLRAGRFRHLAIADPRTAPYGRAAMEVLERLGLAETLAPRIVRGGDVAQAFQFVDTGAAEVGLVALAQVARREGTRAWTVPATLHAPLRQDAVLLTRARDDDAARALLDFLRSDDARAVLAAYGYDVPEE